MIITYILRFFFQKKCKESSYDTSEIDKFENSTLMLKVIQSVSDRIGVSLTYGKSILIGIIFIIIIIPLINEWAIELYIQIYSSFCHFSCYWINPFIYLYMCEYIYI